MGTTAITDSHTGQAGPPVDDRGLECGGPFVAAPGRPLAGPSRGAVQPAVSRASQSADLGEHAGAGYWDAGCFGAVPTRPRNTRGGLWL